MFIIIRGRVGDNVDCCHGTSCSRVHFVGVPVSDETREDDQLSEQELSESSRSTGGAVSNWNEWPR